MVNAGLSAKLKAFSPEWNAGFKNGSFATLACPAWMTGYIKDQAGAENTGKWDITTVPGGGGNWGGSWLGVPTQSKHQKEAVELAKFLTTGESQLAAFKAAGNLPSNPKLYTEAALKDAKNDYFNNAPVGELFVAGAANLKPVYLGAKNQPVRDAVENALRSRRRRTAHARQQGGPRPSRRPRRPPSSHAAHLTALGCRCFSRPAPERHQRAPARPHTQEHRDHHDAHEQGRAGRAPGARAPRTPRWRQRLRRADTRLSPYAMVSPFFILFAVFGLFPLVYTAWVSMHDWSLLAGDQGWLGLGNYSELMQDKDFWNAMLNTFAMFVIATVPQLVLAMVLAQMLNSRLRGDLLADGHPAPERHVGGGGRDHLHDDVQSRLRAVQLGARPRRGRPDRLAGPPLVVLAGDLHDGRLALDRLQRADPAGGAAVGARRDLRGGPHRRGQRLAARSGRSRCRCCARP